MFLESFDKYHSLVDFDQFQETQPVIGILSTEVFGPSMKTNTFPFEQFTWETNVNFVHYAGSWAVPIRWDITDEELYPLLDSINGVFFAGGGSKLIDRDTGELSQLYELSVKIFEYTKWSKDVEGVDFPILGICQGFEIIHYLANRDDKSTLSNVRIFG